MKKTVCFFLAMVVLLPASIFVEQSNREFKKGSELPTAPVAKTAKAIANHVVISEVFYDEGVTGDPNEFVELYNPTSSGIDISNWQLKAYSQAGSLQYTTTIPASTTIATYSFYLIGNKNPLNSTTWGGTEISPDILSPIATNWLQDGPDDYIVLYKSDGTTYVDGVRWGDGSQLAPTITDCASGVTGAPDVAGDSIERRPGETNPTGGNGVDTDNNYNDFLQKATPQPQNTASPTETPAEGPPPAEHVTINEVLYNSLYPEPAGEFIELYNGNTTTPFCIDGWNISDGEGNWQIPNPTAGNDYVIQPKGHVIIANDGNRFFLNYNFYPDFEKSGGTPAVDISLWETVALDNTGDEIILNNSTGKVIDVVVWEQGSYGSVVPYNASEANGESIQRNPEGYEGTEVLDGTSPTGHNEATENMTSGVFTKGTPTPKSADVNPPTISGVSVDARATIAIIRWNTTDGTSWPENNPMSTTEVVYSANANPDSAATNFTTTDEAYVTNHEIMLTNLIPSTTYYFYVKSTDGLGKAAVDKNGSSYYKFTTAAPDYNAPALTSVPTTSVSNTTVIVKWTTNEESTSAVFYGTTTDLVYASSNLILTTNHEVALSELQPSTSYYYEIRSEDPSENVMIANNNSAYYTFTTGTALALNYYWGNFHSHTSYSDGTGTPADAYGYARDTAGINILAITDHSGYLTTTEYNDIKAQALAYTQNGTFVGIAGQEWGNLNDNGHLNVFEASAVCTVATTNLSGFYSWVLSENAISGFNHPGLGSGTNFNGFNYTATGDAAVESLEVINGKRNASYEDDYISALSLGWKIGAFGDQDNHAADWGDKISEGGYIYLTGVIAPYLNKTNVLSAIKSFMVYALKVNSTWKGDKIRLWFSCNGYRMGEVLNASTELKFNITVSAPTNNFTTLYLYEDGKVIDSISGINAKQCTWTPTVSLSKGRHFYFAKVLQEDGDTAWSSPIWASKPVTVLPDEVPAISNVTHNALKSNWTDKITVTAKVTDDKALSKTFVWYSVNGSAYNRISMADDGKTNSDALPNDKIYTAEIPAQANGSSVRYYIAAIDSSGQSKSSPSSAPAYFYSYFVGPHVVINELYSDAPGNETSEFIELYNPTSSAVSLANWTIQDEYQDWYADKFAFPAGASISAGGFVVIARAAGSSTWGYIQNFSAAGNPTYEYGYSSALDNPSIPNLVPIDADSEIKLDNSYDAIHLCNAYGVIIDQVEYGSEGVGVPGTYAPSPAENKSISRDYNSYDSNDCIVDFGILATPSPGTKNNLPPKVWDVKHTAPESGKATNVTVKIHDEALWTNELWYSINAGAYTKLTLTPAGSNLYSAEIPTQTNGTFVSYYIIINDTQPQTTLSPENAPGQNYTYIVGPHIVINEIYVNPPTYYDGAEFIELYNPTSLWVNVSGWRLQDEPWDYGDIGEFPSGLNKTNIPPKGFIVIAKDASDEDGFYQEFGFLPDFELYDGDRTSYEVDNSSVPNLINVTNDAAHDNQIRLDNYPYGDAVYLINQAGMVVDCVEYHMELSGNNTKNHVPGLVATAPWEGESLTRNILETDTDNCSQDFFIAPPTPKANASKSFYYFYKGWNLISLPFSNTTYANARALAKDIPNCKWISKWNSTTQSFDTYSLRSWDAGFDLEPGIGYLVYLESSTGLQIYGKALTSKEVSLGAKWNSVCPLKKDIKASALATSIGANCAAVAKWNTTLGRFITYPVGTGISDFTLMRGDACLVYLTASTTWINQLS